MPSCSRISVLFMAIALGACAKTQGHDEVPDFVVQHTLSTITSTQSFIWEDPQGRNVVIRPVGTFRSGDTYCRDFEVDMQGASEGPVRRTACRLDDRWVVVDSSSPDL